MSDSPVRISVSIGDPAGIGPEVTVRALCDPAVAALGTFRVHGDGALLTWTAESLGLGAAWARAGAVVIDDGAAWKVDSPPGPTAAGGQCSLRWLHGAIEDARRLNAAIVTAPISKEAWGLAAAGAAPRGHTELLQEAFGARDLAMMFHVPGTPSLNVVLVTTHIPLSQVPRTVTRERVGRVIELGAEACVRFGIDRPRVAVCGLNPHAGESGLIGAEDGTVIAPAVEDARRAGVDVQGPFPGDTIFGRAVRGEFDLVVAMYHDQGLIPVKLLAFDRAVNVTLGLPIVRTSPDHGTAYGIAGRGVANPGSMIEAVRLASLLARARAVRR